MPTPNELAWLKSMVPAAQLSMAQWRVPASITLAQCILESAWGQSQLARTCNNYFGVKAEQGQAYGEFSTREVVSGRSVMELARFAKYPSEEESFYAHAKLLAVLPRYAPAMRDCDDAISFATELQHCGYSTSPTYATSLVTLIRELNLTQYDTLPPAAAAAQVAA